MLARHGRTTRRKSNPPHRLSHTQASNVAHTKTSQSQVAPLPSNLPFRIVSKTIGSGAYASIRKAIPPNASGPVIAVKFINKEHAFRTGRLRPKQLELELALHRAVCPHPNVIKYLAHGQDAHWVWLALELAEGGDLFDKIEADEGVGENVAHFYFTQLVEAVSWCHGKGVAHRDVKPENMLLSEAGDLKLADFGLATQFVEPKSGKRKLCGMVCGSPPYIAPEILAVGNANAKRKGGAGGEDKLGYDPQGADVWSCAIVLFVLLAGNTPWDSPVKEESWEFNEFLKTNGRPEDELWEKVPSDALSLLRGMLKTEVGERMGFEAVKRHPWTTRRNPHLNPKGRVADSVALATDMFQRLHINLDEEVPASQQVQSQPDRAMDLDPQRLQQPGWANFAATQPETPIADQAFDWEAPPRLGATLSQPTTRNHTTRRPIPMDFLTQLTEDPSMSQFSSTQPTVPLTLTQAARKFADIMPAHTLTHFYSRLPPSSLLSMLLSSLHRLSIPVPPLPASVHNQPLNNTDGSLSIRIKTVDARKQPLHGTIVLEESGEEGVVHVRFLKAKGDPVGWRRVFKQVAVLCKEGIVVPPGEADGEAPGALEGMGRYS